MLADIFGDDCPCNYNDNDEWLPMKCGVDKEDDYVCPKPDAKCWESYLIYRRSVK